MTLFEKFIQYCMGQGLTQNAGETNQAFIARAAAAGHVFNTWVTAQASTQFANGNSRNFDSVDTATLSFTGDERMVTDAAEQNMLAQLIAFRGSNPVANGFVQHSFLCSVGNTGQNSVVNFLTQAGDECPAAEGDYVRCNFRVLGVGTWIGGTRSYIVKSGRMYQPNGTPIKVTANGLAVESAAKALGLL